jgi:hypothetical protein
MLEALAKRYLDGRDETSFLPELTGDILSRWINHEYAAIIAKGLQVELTENSTGGYADSSELFDDIAQNNHVFVFSLYNEHPLWDEATNQKLRAVHDYRHHFESGRSELGFSLHGEFEAYQKAKDDLFAYLWKHESVPTLELYPTLDKVLFSEIVLQAAVKHFTGEFAPQKIVFN